MRRLQAAVDSRWTVFGKRPMVGRVDAASLRVCKRIGYRNSFQPHLSAQLFDLKGGGTRIRCRFAMHPLVTVFLAFWFGMVLLVGGPVACASLVFALGGSPDGGGPAPGAWVGVAVPPAMFVFGIALIVVGRLLAEGERQFLTETVERVVEARPA